MREIKFRAWCEIPGTDRRFYYLFKIGETVPPQYSVLIWEQYTGLKDKNGTDIYEGDIVKADDPQPPDPLFDIDGRNGVIKFRSGGFVADFLGIDCVVFQEVIQFEIIGNIHENPELMENKRT